MKNERIFCHHLTSRYKQLFFLFISVAFILTSHSVRGQSSLDFSYTLHKTSSINPINNFDTTYAWECVIQLQDTSIISNIHFKMGDAYGTSNLVDHAFIFDDDAFLPDGLIYRRKGFEIVLGLGNYLDRHYFIEVQLEDTTGTYSTKINWDNL